MEGYFLFILKLFSIQVLHLSILYTLECKIGFYVFLFFAIFRNALQCKTSNAINKNQRKREKGIQKNRWGIFKWEWKNKVIMIQYFFGSSPNSRLINSPLEFQHEFDCKFERPANIDRNWCDAYSFYILLDE